MSVNSVNSTNGNGGAKSFFSTLLSSAANVGATVAAGGVVGAAGGNIASLVPTKIKEADIDAQLCDMFCKIAKEGEKSPLLAKTDGALLDNLKKTLSLLKPMDALDKKLFEAKNILEQIAFTSEDVIENQELLDKIKQLLGKTGDGALNASVTKESAVEKVTDFIAKITDDAKKYGEELGKLKDEFLPLAKQNEKFNELAKEGVKHFKKTSTIGIGIAIGVVGALVLNLLKTYGVIGRSKKNKEA